MNLLVVGGTGRTGMQIVRAALGDGHRVVVLARSATPDTVPSGAEARQGSAVDREALFDAMRGVDAVITALSIPRRSRSPLAAVTGPPDLHSHSSRLIVEGMTSMGIRRLVKVSAQGVAQSARRAGWLFRLLVATTNLRPAFADHAVADAFIENSDVDYTIVRPPILAEGGSRGGVVASENVRTWSWSRVAIVDLATFVVNALEEPRWSRRCVSLRTA